MPGKFMVERNWTWDQPWHTVTNKLTASCPCQRMCGLRWKITDWFVWCKARGPQQQDCSQWDSEPKHWSGKVGKNEAQPGKRLLYRQGWGYFLLFKLSALTHSRGHLNPSTQAGQLTTACKNSSRGSMYSSGLTNTPTSVAYITDTYTKIKVFKWSS